MEEMNNEYYNCYYWYYYTISNSFGYCTKSQDQGKECGTQLCKIYDRNGMTYGKKE